MTTNITVTLAVGNFETAMDAETKARAYERIAAERFPGAEIDVRVLPRQTFGSKTVVVIDGDEDEAAAAYLDSLCDNEW